MNRKDFLKGMGLAGLGTFLPFGSTFAGTDDTAKTNACVLIPSETAGPYPLNLSTNAAMFRTDIRESKTGIQLNVKLKIIGVNNCLPIQNARVDIWHCDKDGYYSGYSNVGYLGTQNNVGQTFCRGIQMTDANGEVNFTTIFPGWYVSRVTHIHFQVFLNSVLQATSQFTFPVTTKNSIYTSNSLYSAHGTDPQSISTDNVFSDGATYQTATLTPNATTGGYDTFLEVGINGSGVTGLQKLEPETGGQFKMLQNYPNPYETETTIPFSLTYPSDVKIELYDLMGRKVAHVERANMAAGEQRIELNLANLQIAKTNYAYQLTVSNKNGAFSQCKMMTAQ
jgi:protocatechuate 3,4-dioxygenase beta subunit